MSVLMCLGGIFDFDVKLECLEEVSWELESFDVWNELDRV